MKTVTQLMHCLVQNKGRQRPSAKATLYGLSSIRREGDVTVNMMSSHTTVRTKFTVGPLILKVEKEVCMCQEKNGYMLDTFRFRIDYKLNELCAIKFQMRLVLQKKMLQCKSYDSYLHIETWL
jgi:hypothetical protein